MAKNPWLEPLNGPDFVLENDRPHVAAWNQDRDPTNAHFLRVYELLPEPFIGPLDAPVLLLSNNPGLSEPGDKQRARQNETFRGWVCKNLRHEPLAYPFYYLHPEFTLDRSSGGFGGGDWWDRKLKHLLWKDKRHLRFDRQLLARSVLNVVYFPYPSLRFGHRKCPVDSQAHGFDLVRAAIERDAVIIHMRKPSIWDERVPALKNYKRRFRVANTQTPVITANLLDLQGHRRGFQKTIDTIEAFISTNTANA